VKSAIASVADEVLAIGGSCLRFRIVPVAIRVLVNKKAAVAGRLLRLQ
jgi:hypothetical protein